MPARPPEATPRPPGADDAALERALDQLGAVAVALVADAPGEALALAVVGLLGQPAVTELWVLDLRPAELTAPLLPVGLLGAAALRLRRCPGLGPAAAVATVLPEVQAAHLVIRADHGAPPAELSAQLRRLRLSPRAVALGRGLPPAGLARSALDVLSLHLLPHDAAADAPLRWPAVPGAVPVALPVGPLRAQAAWDGDEPDLELAVQVAVLRLSTGGCPLVREPGFSWSLPRRSPAQLEAAVRAHACARVGRLARDPEGPLDGGWALASRAGLRRSLDGDRLGRAAEELVGQLGGADPGAMLTLGVEWERLARELLRRLLLLLPRAVSRWSLQGIDQGLERVGAAALPALLARRPLQPAGRAAMLLPVDRPRLELMEAALAQAVPLCGPGGALVVVLAAEAAAELEARHPARRSSWLLRAALRDVELVIFPLGPAPSTLVRLVAGARALLTAGALQGESWGLVAKALPVPVEALPPAPALDPLGARPVRLLAAPPWGEPLGLELFLAEVLAPVLGAEAVSLYLLFDPARGESSLDARLALRRATASLAPPDGAKAEVLVMALPADPEEQARLGLAAHALVGPASPELAAALGAPLAPVEAVLALWDGVQVG